MVIPKYIWLLGCLAALLFWASGSINAPARANEGLHRATVTATHGRFEFPVTARDTLHWFKATTPQDVLEYTWHVRVQTEQETYQFGFWVFKCPGPVPASGDLEGLLAAGQKSVFISNTPRAGFWCRLLPGVFGCPRKRFSLVPGAQVQVSVNGQRLVVEVTDAETLDLLFSGYPAEVTFVEDGYGVASTSRKVDVMY